MSDKTLSTSKAAKPVIEVVTPGIQTTIQDYPGRRGYWNIGVPPSGPMDSLAFRLANRLVGNEEGQAAIEITFAGPTLRIHCDSVIAVTGAPVEVTLNGKPLAQWKSHKVEAGTLLVFGDVLDQGSRVYLAIQGGIDVPDYLGSKSTFMLGQFGGHEGRILQAGDMLNIAADLYAEYVPHELPQAAVPQYTHHWKIAVLYGPHGAPDFFTEKSVTGFFAAEWVVHHNSDRTGVRLIGPKPEWARTDGGEAGLHPSNVHDVPYSIGAVDFTGDLPVILGPDGPSLGGFVCLVTVAYAEQWKMGQLRPGDRITFQRITADDATALEASQDAFVRSLHLPETISAPTTIKTATSTSPDTPILHTIPEAGEQVQVVYRQAGDKNLLVEYGSMTLDFNLRFRIHALMEWLQQAVDGGDLPGIVDLTPGIRSLHIRFDSRILPRSRLLDTLVSAEQKLPSVENMEVPTRIVHLPLSWNDSSVQLAMKRYMQSVRKDAPWNPDNIEFIRRINGLNSIDEVRNIIFDASYLVMGLGDVYLGAPLGTPVDPRHRLVTTKYNPARTWTPENAVGIGGAYMCVYGMESPGGYQLVGRTIQMWNSHIQTKDFKEGKPWLLRFFDQVRFYPVTEAELAKIRRDFPNGRFSPRIEEDRFNLKQYNNFLKEHAVSIDAFKTKQKAAYIAERERWKADGQENYTTSEPPENNCVPHNITIPTGTCVVNTHLTGIVWKLLVSEGQHVNTGDALAVLESMKMEFTIKAPVSGVVHQIFSQAGSKASARQILFLIREGAQNNAC